MASYIHIKEVFPGVFDLCDRMGMHETLLVGTKAALLFDTGYGMDDLNAAVRAITTLPLTVLLSHGHHDHACGSPQFDTVYVHKDDIPVCEYYATTQRRRILGKAEERGVTISDLDKEAYVAAGCGRPVPLSKRKFDLGGLTANVIPLPGHTKGSIGLLIPQHRLMLTGDTWNLTTWVFFSECMPIGIYLKSLRRMTALDFSHVLCPHANGVIPREKLDAFSAGLTEEMLIENSCREPELYPDIMVYSCHPTPETTFCFDAEKLPRHIKKAFFQRNASRSVI